MTDNRPAKVRQETSYWLTSVRSKGGQTASEVIDILVGQEKIFAFAERTPNRKYLKPGDRICFYESRRGVVAHAIVASKPENQPHPKVRNNQRYSWTFKLEQADLYLSDPIVINLTLVSRLEAFRGRDPSQAWNWLVQATTKLTENDFKILTGQSKNTPFLSDVSERPPSRYSEPQSVFTDEFQSRSGPSARVRWPRHNDPTKRVSIVDDSIEDSDIGPLWAKHFPMIADDVGSKIIVLALLYIIEDKATASTTDGDWSDRVSQELRRYGIPVDQFWEIQSASR
jgi:hypothetical protein